MLLPFFRRIPKEKAFRMLTKGENVIKHKHNNVSFKTTFREYTMTANVFVYKDFGNIKAQVNLDRCDGCAFCLNVCPFKALSLVTERPMERHIVINKKLCRGCGLCQGTCPKQAVFVQGFSMDELSQKITNLLND